MRVLLVSYSGKPLHPDNFMPDNGLAQLAACIRQEGHECRVLYLNTPRLLGELNTQEKVEAEVLREVHRTSADVVGFKLYINGFHDSIRIAERVRKKYPDISILAGGPQVTYFEEKVYDVTDVFDILTTGEGERTIGGILRAIEGRQDLATVPNIIYRPAKGLQPLKTERVYVQDLESLPDPAWDVYEHQMKELWPIFVFSISRGCAVKCAFCTHPYIWGDRFRSRPMEAVIREVRSTTEAYGITHYRLADSTPVPGMLQRFSEGIIEQGLDIRWSGYAYSRMVNPGVLSLIKQAGCIFLWYGLESSNETILANMNKKQVASNMADAAAATRAAGIPFLTSLIVGFPGETEETIEHTFEFVKSIQPDSVQVTALGLVPQTPLAKDPEKYGIQVKGDWERELMQMKFAGMDKKSTKGRGYIVIGGKPWEHWQEKAAELVQRFQQENILTQTTDDLHLMADLVDTDIRAFREKVDDYLKNGRQAKMERLIRKGWKMVNS